ncbi:GNAT family N-acetyltransferase [Streptomyces sp. NBC_00838]|nr:GNAT family N-acetyltransferase [Streptomyces sp. NBC_00838]
MAIVLGVPGVDGLGEAVGVLREWQDDGAPTQLHPGDLGWHAMAAGSPYADARCLVAHDDGDAVAAVTVWSAGPGRLGLLEPMGVHREHRGHGYGRAITVAAAAALRDLGSSSAIVCTPSSNTGAVATYRSAGFQRRPEVRGRYRDA